MFPSIFRKKEGKKKSSAELAYPLLQIISLL